MLTINNDESLTYSPHLGDIFSNWINTSSSVCINNRLYLRSYLVSSITISWDSKRDEYQIKKVLQGKHTTSIYDQYV